ncbi:LysR family transcriptional regulator [Vibrio neonatus]|uniref:LysR family transcriptional regulator n=1 Tax=Vibrio neonatus TaxID=278860 RepID=UPI0021C41AE2|nr:LysR family transcriptional regulator [Vibrio neonatus]
MLKELVLFKYVYEGDNFRDVASKANTSISSLSRAITNLEQDCGKKLFIKDGITLIPTSEGKYLYSKITASLDSVTYEYDMFRTSTPQITLLKPIQVNSTFFIQLLHDEALKSEQLSFKELNNYPTREKAYSDLLIGEIDLFIDKKPITDRRYQCHKIQSDELVFLCSKQFHENIIESEPKNLIKLKWLDDYSDKFTSNADTNEYLIDSLISFYDIIENSKYTGIVSEQTAKTLDHDVYSFSEVIGKMELYLIVANRNIVNKPLLKDIIKKIQESKLILR